MALATPSHAGAPVTPTSEAPALLGIPVDFLLFAATLLGVAFFHRHTLPVALAGLTAIVLNKLLFGSFDSGPGLDGLAHHLAHEWVSLTNLFLLLLGFAILARHFDRSRACDILPSILPDDWKGGFALLALVFVLSAFLDNIAAALIGGAIARSVFQDRVHVGFLAAIVAAANAGGAGSVVGDTTTTMMWIKGVSPLAVLEAYVAAVVALFVFGIPASLQQNAHQPIVKDATPGVVLDVARIGIVATILASAVLANVLAHLFAPALLDQIPVIGLAVWAAIAATALIRQPDWSATPEMFKGTLFLLSLVLSASLMPVEQLPPASWPTAFGLGFVSAEFDNIPLTALALKQGGYDWGYLAYAVGFGGSMIWFGSSAGAALASLYPEAKSVGRWLVGGWHVAVAYVVGFFLMLLVIGWHPNGP
jgi:Na+/H+ antiporter NhaD/arsenite permease-like protein